MAPRKLKYAGPKRFPNAVFLALSQNILPGYKMTQNPSPDVVRPSMCNLGAWPLDLPHLPQDLTIEWISWPATQCRCHNPCPAKKKKNYCHLNNWFLARLSNFRQPFGMIFRNGHLLQPIFRENISKVRQRPPASPPPPPSVAVDIFSCRVSRISAAARWRRTYSKGGMGKVMKYHQMSHLSPKDLESKKNGINFSTNMYNYKVSSQDESECERAAPLGCLELELACQRWHSQPAGPLRERHLNDLRLALFWTFRKHAMHPTYIPLFQMIYSIYIVHLLHLLQELRPRGHWQS